MPKVTLPVLDLQISYFEKSKVEFTTVAHHYMGDENLETVELECTSENILRVQNSDIHFTKETKPCK